MIRGLQIAALVAATTLMACDTVVPASNRVFHPTADKVGSVKRGHFRSAIRGGDSNWTCWTDADGEGEIIPWNTLVTWHCPTAGIVCFTMTIEGGDIQLNTSTGVITDSATNRGFSAGAAPDGAGTCFMCDGYFAQVLSKAPFMDTVNTPLIRDGVCSDPAGAPCRQASDCDVSETATCDVSVDQIRSGAILGAHTCWEEGIVDFVTME